MTREAPARILIVEDEEALAEGLRFNLERKHNQVDVAANGRTGLELAHGRAGAGHECAVMRAERYTPLPERTSTHA